MLPNKIFITSLSLLLISSLLMSCSNTGNVVREYPKIDLSEDCVLSLCDCRCYVVGETPEERSNKICGNDCLSQTGVQGCELVNDTCQPLYVD